MITLREIKKARKAISRLARRTTLVRSKFLSDFCRGEVYLKLENEQLTNSFKIRGALNRMTQLSPEERRNGVVTASSGNHGQAVALIADHLQLSAKIVVPLTTSKAKLAKIKKYNVELILYGDFDEVEEKARELAEKEGRIYISPYNDEFVIIGQGTIGLEILEDFDSVDIIIVPIGGGGLISGIAVAVKGILSNIQVIGVQSEVAQVMCESVKAGRVIDAKEGESIAEGLLGGLEKGTITLSLIQEYVDELLVVKEETIKEAIYLLWEKEHQKVEGAGAITIAAILENRELFTEKNVVAVLSGGNIEDSLFEKVLRDVRKKKK